MYRQSNSGVGGFRERVRQPKVSKNIQKTGKHNKVLSSIHKKETEKGQRRADVFDGNIIISCKNSQIFSQGCFIYPRYTHKKGTEKKMCNVQKMMSNIMIRSSVNKILIFFQVFSEREILQLSNSCHGLTFTYLCLQRNAMLLSSQPPYLTLLLLCCFFKQKNFKGFF